MQISITAEELQKRKLMICTPMYAGQCAGLYTRSMTDLTALCVKYGIEMKFFALFNESLITRARNYCVDEFLRSGFGHLLFLDSDIGFNANDVIAMLALQSDESDYDILAAPYPKKSVHKNTKILTEEGYKTIKNIVDTKYNGKVLTIDNDGNISWNNVIEYHKNPNNNKWVEVNFTKNVKRGKKLTITYDHEISCIENVLFPKITFVRVDNMLGKYTATAIENTKSIELFNEESIYALIGTLFGDSSISKRDNRLMCGHGQPQLEYLKYKQHIFGGTIHQYDNAGYGKATKTKINQLYSVVNAQTKYLRELMYDNDTKTIKHLTDYINPISLAFWYMDDGCLKKSGNTSHYCELNTQGFSDKDQQILVDMFKSKYDINIAIDEMQATAKNITKRVYKRLRMRNEDSDKFFNIVAPYIHPSMRYKLPEQFRDIEFIEINNEKYNFAASKVETITRIESDSDQYDIGVENNHNFVANGIHISNCISWEKIKTAVDKGLADEDPNSLERFVGDYVFNPVASTNQIPINEPAEVMETGTGFMMIKRSVFERYEQAYPQYHYKPDHVRSEHFDGSREIMAYFDCIIDPESKRYLSEDYMFCQNVRKMGGKVWLCPWISTQHVGMYVFGGSLADLASIGASATADISQLKKKRL